MPRLTSETFGGGDQSWLGSAHGIGNARTETIDISAFTKATHYPDGYIPSGMPLAKVGGLMVPYDPTAGTTTDAGILAGHLFTDFKVSGTADLPAPVLDHGRVKTAKVKTILAALANFAAPSAAKNATTIVYI
ncbi:hypothetical protein J2X60_003009 [Curtobacterium sp. 320]|uniref:head decoration protein n=1 Tax=Curtobacterium sp. 320 TaxID=2817749 RepID=UPI00285D7DB2|nr:head decoration protein [Curtobacterium sp. 320]MDR6574350.1 hypothetical protein [Curtobacterium sp. 320]